MIQWSLSLIILHPILFLPIQFFKKQNKAFKPHINFLQNLVSECDLISCELVSSIQRRFLVEVSPSEMQEHAFEQ